MKVLVLAPHPDDEVLGCGGVIARGTASGHETHVVVITRGAADIFDPAGIAATRVEMRKAHGILGVAQTHELEFPAPRTDTVAIHIVADQIRKIVKEVQPDVVYVPHHGDLHHEHEIVYTAGLVASRPTHSSVRKILAYETLSETDWAPARPDTTFIPNVFTDISQFVHLKLDAMRCFQSQLHVAPAPRSVEALEALARLRGSTIGVHAAEAFMLVREIV